MIVYNCLFIPSGLLSFFPGEKAFDGTAVELIKMSVIQSEAGWLNKTAQDRNRLPFCLDVDIPLNQEVIAWLIRAAFLSNYYKPGNRIKFFAADTNHKIIEDAFLEQGYTSVDVISINTLIPISVGPVKGYLNNSITHGIPDFIITEIEAVSSKGDVLLYFQTENSLVRSMRILTDEKRKIENDYNETATELNNYKQYLEIALKEKETEKIITFYHKEYEVLPLWYKKFGHLIKIITGKRPVKKIR
jgi:hypothetical protein